MNLRNLGRVCRTGALFEHANHTNPKRMRSTVSKVGTAPPEHESGYGVHRWGIGSLIKIRGVGHDLTNPCVTLGGRKEFFM